MVKDFGKIVSMIVMKVSLKMTKNVGKEFLNGLQEMYIKEIILMNYVMVMVKCIGLMVFFLKNNKGSYYKGLWERGI